jgi:SAM-dependent methyltransferase
MTENASDGYRDDLAYIHDAGFGAFAARSSPWLLKLFRARHLVAGRVVDLGCGSGIWAEALAQAGYEALGYDISPAMIAIARRRVPSAQFRRASFLTADLPPCVAVTSLGEIFNYLFDRQNTPRRLDELFGRVYEALCPGGLFVFDAALVGRVPGGHVSNFSEGPEWACLFEADETRDRRLTRRITSFRKVGKSWRRDHEIHRLRLYDRGELVRRLRRRGFRVRTVDGYGEFRFPPGYAGFVARKP